MNSAAFKPQLIETFQNVRRFSFEVKQEAVLDEKKINHFLDKLLDFQKALTDKSLRIEILIEKIEEMTWFNDLDKDSLMLINDLISTIRSLHLSLTRQYVSLNPVRIQGLAKSEIKNFKGVIDDLKDVANDLDSRFFFLPAMEQFQETTKELSLI